MTKVWVRSALVVGMLSACINLTGCIQGTSFASTQKDFAKGRDVSEQTVLIINRQLRQSLHAGGWLLKGTEKSRDGLDAYIKIPHHLALNEQHQQNYLRQAVCRLVDDPRVWRDMGDLSLRVHIFITNKADSVSAKCDSPYA